MVPVERSSAFPHLCTSTSYRTAALGSRKSPQRLHYFCEVSSNREFHPTAAFEHSQSWRSAFYVGSSSSLPYRRMQWNVFEIATYGVVFFWLDASRMCSEFRLILHSFQNHARGREHYWCWRNNEKSGNDFSQSSSLLEITCLINASLLKATSKFLCVSWSKVVIAKFCGIL